MDRELTATSKCYRLLESRRQLFLLDPWAGRKIVLPSDWLLHRHGAFETAGDKSWPQKMCWRCLVRWSLKPMWAFIESRLNLHMGIKCTRKLSRHTLRISCVHLDTFWMNYFFNTTQYCTNEKNVPLLFHLTAVRHFKLAGDWFDSSVCTVLKVMLHQFTFGSLSFSVRTVLEKKQNTADQHFLEVIRQRWVLHLER